MNVVISDGGRQTSDDGSRAFVTLPDGQEYRLKEVKYEDGWRLEITGGVPAHQLAVYPQMANVIQLENRERSLR